MQAFLLYLLREKLKQQGRAVDLAARAQEHQSMLSAFTRQPVRLLALRSIMSQNFSLN
jgi:hypothetical protein